MEESIFDKIKSPEHRYLFYDDVVLSLLKGGASLELAQGLLLLLYRYYKDDGSCEFINEQVLRLHEELLENDSYRQKRNLQQEVDDLISFRGKGQILLNDIYSDLKVVESRDKATCRMAINRLISRGVLEKIDTGRTGTYRLLDTSSEETKFLTSPKGEFKIRLPLGLSGMCNIFPKNIIVIAGSKSSGKTSLLLNIALENQNKHPVVYLNSEMGDEEFTDRMTKLGCNNPQDVKFKCFHRSSDYHDMVDGNGAIYIIDFLEVHDKFYEIAKPIKQIHEKLRDGIAIIGIQMKSGTTIGRGGDFSKEKSRLYLALDFIPQNQCTKVTIEEMKSPKNEEGYRGWHRNIKIINGSMISPLGNWSNIPVTP